MVSAYLRNHRPYRFYSQIFKWRVLFWYLWIL